MKLDIATRDEIRQLQAVRRNRLNELIDLRTQIWSELVAADFKEKFQKHSEDALGPDTTRFSWEFAAWECSAHESCPVSESSAIWHTANQTASERALSMLRSELKMKGFHLGGLGDVPSIASKNNYHLSITW